MNTLKGTGTGPLFRRDKKRKVKIGRWKC